MAYFSHSEVKINPDCCFIHLPGPSLDRLEPRWWTFPSYTWGHRIRNKQRPFQTVISRLTPAARRTTGLCAGVYCFMGPCSSSPTQVRPPGLFFGVDLVCMKRPVLSDEAGRHTSSWPSRTVFVTHRQGQRFGPKMSTERQRTDL